MQGKGDSLGLRRGVFYREGSSSADVGEGLFHVRDRDGLGAVPVKETVLFGESDA